MKSPVIKRSILLAGHKTSVSLEDAFWQGLKEIAGKRATSLSALIAKIDAGRHEGNLSSAIRLFVLEHFSAQAASNPAGNGLRQDDKTGVLARMTYPASGAASRARPPGFRPA